MNFNAHYHLEGHAFLSPSKFHWINDDEEKLISRFSKHQAAQRGDALHELAHQCITLGVKLPRTKQTLNSFVNDAIGFKMHPEQKLYYSENCYGTADTISFKNNVLRIHDLKTGETTASMKQLMVYASIFCLEYGVDPSDITTELRIYQSDEIMAHVPDPDEIHYIMDKIIQSDKKIEEMKAGG